jgi:hypothetical protein
LKSTALQVLNATHKIAAFLPSCGNFRPVRGSFSAYQQLKEGKLEGKVVAEHQALGSCPPGSMTERAGFQQHDHQPWPIFWAKSKDARLVGKMFLWRNPEDRICSESVYGIVGRRRLGEDTCLAQLILEEPETLAGAWTSITSPWNDCRNYYHWLLDGLTRLSTRDRLPEPTGILLPPDLPKFAQETLALLGLQDCIHLAKTSCIKPDNYYFCAPTAMTGVWNPDGYQWLRKKFSPYFGPKDSGPPIFLTRRGGARIPENLASIEAIFDSHGFQIIDCGAITVREQILAISSAGAIAGLHGAAMTNLLWAEEDTPVVEIFEPGYLNACYEQIAHEGRLYYSYIINSGNDALTEVETWCSRTTKPINSNLVKHR